MQQWIVKFSIDTPAGPRVLEESYYMPSQADVRHEVTKRGGYVLTIRPHARSNLERWLVPRR